MDSTHAPVEMLISVWKVLSLPSASLPLPWLSLFLLKFPLEGEDWYCVVNFANSRYIRLLNLVLSAFIYIFLMSYFITHKWNSRDNSSFTSKMVEGKLCQLFSLTQKAVGIAFLFWNPFFFADIPLSLGNGQCWGCSASPTSVPKVLLLSELSSTAQPWHERLSAGQGSLGDCWFEKKNK